MNKTFVYILMMIAILASVSAATIDFASDTNTKYSYDFSTWSNSVLTYNKPEWPTIDGSQWIWTSYHVTDEEASDGTGASFQKTVELPDCATNIHASVTMDADNWYFLSLNGDFVGQGWDWTTPQTFDIDLKPGNNLLDISVVNTPLNNGNWETNPAGLIYKGQVTYDCGEEEVPEFSVIAGTMALIGAIGIFIYRRKN